MVSSESFISKELLKLYTSKDKEVLAHRKVFDGADSYITFVAKSFRSDRTGIHAQLQVYRDRNQVAYDNINIEKADQRYKLARVAYAHPLLPRYIRFLFNRFYESRFWITSVSMPMTLVCHQ